MTIKTPFIAFIVLIIFIALPSFAQDQTQEEALQQAADYYVKKIRSDPNNLALHRELIETYRERNLIDIPIAIYSNSIQQNLGNPIVFYVLGYAHLMSYGRPLIDGAPDPLQAAEENLQAALKIKPQFPDALTALGDCYLKSGQKELALEKWQKAIEINSKFEPAYLSLARFYRSQRKYEEAIDEYRVIISLNPKRIAERYLELGIVYFEMGNLDDAEAEFQNARRKDRKMAMAYYKLGQVYAKRKDRENALKMYRDGRKHDPKNAEVAYELAHIFLDTDEVKYALLSMERGLSVDAVDDSLAQELMALVDKDTAEAASFMSRLANFDYSSNFHLHYFLGKLYLKLENEELALKYFKSAAELSDSNADVFYQLGRLQEKAEPEKAEEQFQKAAEISTSGETESVMMDRAAEADLLYKAAQGYLEQGFEMKFIETAQQALVLNPKRGDIHLQLARIFQKRSEVYRKSGKKEQETEMLEKAVKHYEQAVTLQPTAEGWYELGLLYERQDNIKAVRAYDKAIQLNPDFALAYYRRGDFRLNFKVGRISVRMYQPEVAIEDLKKAIELDPRLADAHFSLGLAYHQMNKPELATEQYAKTVEINPNHLKANIYLAQDYEAAGESQKAIKHYSKAAELDDSNGEVLRALGSLQLRYGGDAGVKPAREALAKAVKLKPDDAEVLMNYAYTLYLGLMFDSAIDYYKKALEIQPDYLEANYNIALAYNRIGKTDLARQHWERVIEIWPDSRLAIRAADFLSEIKKAQK